MEIMVLETAKDNASFDLAQVVSALVSNKQHKIAVYQGSRCLLSNGRDINMTILQSGDHHVETRYLHNGTHKCIGKPCFCRHQYGSWFVGGDDRIRIGQKHADAASDAN